jgi:Fe-S-cluster containining protein
MKGRDIDLCKIESRLFQVAAELLSTAHDQKGLAAVMSAFADSVEELAGHQEVACRAGCSHCCVLNVAVLLPEAAVIAAWLELRTPENDRASVLQKLQKQAVRVRWMEDGERIHRSTVCPFLDQAGRCGIYPVRPLVCRGVTSLDREACREVLDPSVFDSSFAVPMDTARKLVIDVAFCALAHALDRQKIMSRSIELSAGVALFLGRPELVRSLLQGESFPASLWE